MTTVIQDFTTEDIDYVRHGDRPLTLRLFRPAGAGPFPAVVVLHPGGWAHVDLTGCQQQGEAWAQAGLTITSLDFQQGVDLPDRYQLCHSLVQIQCRGFQY